MPRSAVHKALIAAIVDPGRKHAPPGPVPRKKPRTGATGESQSWDQDPRNRSGNSDTNTVRKGGMVAPQKKPKKTVEGFEPWQWDDDDPRRNRRKV